MKYADNRLHWNTKWVQHILENHIIWGKLSVSQCCKQNRAELTRAGENTSRIKQRFSKTIWNKLTNWSKSVCASQYLLSYTGKKSKMYFSIGLLVLIYSEKSFLNKPGRSKCFLGPVSIPVQKWKVMETFCNSKTTRRNREGWDSVFILRPVHPADVPEV